MKLVWRQTQWKYMFNENIAKVRKNNPVTIDHFGQTFQCKVSGYMQTFKIYGLNPRGIKWVIWARGLGGSEHKFKLEVLDYIGGIAPAELCGGQEYLPIR